MNLKHKKPYLGGMRWLIILLLIQTGCTSPSELDKVKAGMTASEVIELVGEPTEKVALFTLAEEGTTEMWHYGSEAIQVVDGTVTKDAALVSEEEAEALLLLTR